MREHTSKIEIRRSASVGWEVVVERVATSPSDTGGKYMGVTGTTKYACRDASDVSAVVVFALEN